MIGRAAAILAALALLAGAAPAEAKTLAYTVSLDGHHSPTDTGSNATGEARILVDTDTRTVDVTLDVSGLTLDQLWGPLAHSAMGPIHLHRYGSHNHDSGADSVLVFPLPMGPSYAATASGFHVEVQHVDYAQAAALVHSTLAFEDFVSAMNDGLIVLNIHSNANHDGEISGPVLPAGGDGGMRMLAAPLACAA
jgi:hypothetical protein